MDNDHHLESDINDVFEAIAFSEDQIANQAFEEGLQKGKLDGKAEGYHIGFHKGLQLGTEIGFYAGVTKVLSSNIDKLTFKNAEKIRLLLEKLSASVKNFPRNNNHFMDMMKEVENVRADYRKLNSMLRLNLSYPNTSFMSF